MQNQSSNTSDPHPGWLSRLVRREYGRRTPNASLPRCCWLDRDQHMCRNMATGRKIVFADPEGISHGEWFWVPVCHKHGGPSKPNAADEQRPAPRP